MKTKILIIAAVAGLLFFVCKSYIQARSINQSQATITMLTNFYTNYFNEFVTVTDPNVMESNLSKLRSQYCTSNLLDKFNNDTQTEDLDYDPFIKAQDANAGSIKTLAVVQDVTNPNLYTITYTDPYDNVKRSVSLTIATTTDGPKIDSVAY